MSGKTLTRADLAEAVFQKVGLPRNESAEIVELVLREIVASLERGDTVKLSSFGSFGIRDKGQRIGRNPKTGAGSSHHAAARAGVSRKQHHETTDQRCAVAKKGSRISRRRFDASREDGRWIRRQRRFARSARLLTSLKSRSTCCASGKPNSPS